MLSLSAAAAVPRICAMLTMDMLAGLGLDLFGSGQVFPQARNSGPSAGERNSTASQGKRKGQARRECHAAQGPQGKGLCALKFTGFDCAESVCNVGKALHGNVTG